MNLNELHANKEHMQLEHPEPNNMQFNPNHAGYAQFGWNAFFDASFAPYRAEGYIAGRVALEHKHMYRILTPYGELLGEVAGKMRYNAMGREDYPAVGDWVVMRHRQGEGKATIHAILPRKSKFSRKVAGMTTEEQIIAANVDTVFLVSSLNQDFNVRRLERYLIMAWESGAQPIVILSKADLCQNVSTRVSEVMSIAPGVSVHAVSALTRQGIDELQRYLCPGTTVALLGSSGVGKSTLTNELFGAGVQQTSEIREDDGRGRHTTTHRELVLLPSGAMLIDTPGMRELQLWDSENGLESTFEDVEQYAEACMFRDCKHEREPGCAVQAAIAEGTLDAARYENYIKLQRELAFVARKENQRLRMAEKAQGKKRSKDARKTPYR